MEDKHFWYTYFSLCTFISIKPVVIAFLPIFLDGIDNCNYFIWKLAHIHLWKVAANAATVQYSKWPPTRKYYYIKVSPVELEWWMVVIFCYFWHYKSIGEIIVEFQQLRDNRNPIWPLNSHYPPFWKIPNFNTSGAIWARMTNEVSFPTNFDITNPLEWLLKHLGVTLTSNFKMVTFRHIGNAKLSYIWYQISQNDRWTVISH